MRTSIPPGRYISSNLFYCLIGTCAILSVICACLLSSIIMIRQYEAHIKEKEQLGDNIEYQKLPMEPWEQEHRIPAHTVPKHYNLFLNPRLDDGTFNGTVDIDILISAPAPFLVVHSKGLNITKTEVLIGNQSVKIRDAFLSERNAFWVVRFPKGEPLQPGEVQLKLVFHSELTGKIVGFYRSTYRTARNTKRNIATSKFEPTHARQAFPCFDEPGLKATFTISLVHPKNEYTSLSNMDVQAEVEGPGPLDMTTVFKPSVPMSTYLVCFIVSDFTSLGIQNVENGVGVQLPVQVLATPDQTSNTAFALSTALEVVAFYVEYFGIPYKLPKLDLIAIPDFVSGAMENWGLITFRETALLFNKDTNSIANKKRVAHVVAHEIAHQWFGNLVTMQWWDDLWLNEGFARFMEAKALANGVPDYLDTHELEHAAYDVLQPVLLIDAALNSHPIVQEVTHPDQINQLFDTISYEKGASVLRMLENFLGADAFKKGLQKYLADKQFQNAATADLWAALSAVAPTGVDVAGVMATWTNQMGFPVIQVKRNADTVELTQQRFLTDSNATFDATESPFGYQWDIPVTYITPIDPTSRLIWLHRNAKITLPINNTVQYIKLNSKQIGVYRVNYDTLDWNTFAKIYSTFDEQDRAHLLDDVLNLASAGYTQYSVALKMLQNLKSETGFLPWATAKAAISNLDTQLYTTSTYHSFKDFIVSLVSVWYGSETNQFTWTVDESDSNTRRMLRTTILSLACSAGLSTCLKDVGTIFTTWLEKPSTPIHPDLRSLVYLYGMKATGTRTDWDKLLKIYLSETNAQEKTNLQQALAYAQDPTLLTKYLELAWSEEYVRSQDYFAVFDYISKNPVGTQLAWDYYRSHWQDLVARFTLSNRTLGSFILKITSSFATEAKLDELLAFYAKYPEAGAGTAARKNAVENVQTRINWVKKNSQTISDWLTENSPNKSP